MARLTTHVLDTANGVPGNGIRIELFRLGDDRELVATAVTNGDGRTDEPLIDGPDTAGEWELVFYVGDYFAAGGHELATPRFLDRVPLRFGLTGTGHFHVPLLVSPWSYSTYRGS